MLFPFIRFIDSCHYGSRLFNPSVPKHFICGWITLKTNSFQAFWTIYCRLRLDAASATTFRRIIKPEITDFLLTRGQQKQAVNSTLTYHLLSCRLTVLANSCLFTNPAIMATLSFMESCLWPPGESKSSLLALFFDTTDSSGNYLAL